MPATSAQLKADLESSGYIVTLSSVGTQYACALTAGPTADCSSTGRGATQEVGKVNALRNVRRRAGIPDIDLIGAEFLTLVDELPTKDYGDVSGPVTIDMGNGNGLRQKLTLTGSLTTAGDITIEPPEVSRTIKFRITQGGAGNFAVDAVAWPANANFGDKAPPTFGEAADVRRFLVFDFEKGDSDVCIHYDTNFF